MNSHRKYAKYNCIDSEIEQYLGSLSDDRIWTSNIEDIDGGDNFADYCKEFFELLEEEEYYDN